MSATSTPSAPGSSDAPEQLSMSAVLRIPVMRRLWMAQVVSFFGDFLALFAVINFLTFTLHATPEQVTGIQISYMLPIALLGIVAGVFVDRWPLKATLVTSDLTRAALCLLLLLAVERIHFYLILAAMSIFSSFFGPAQGVAIRSAVPLHGLRSANSLLQQVMFGMRIVGPGLAGLCYKLLGAHACYLGDSISFLASGCLIASVALVPPASATTAIPLAGRQAELETELDATLPPTPQPAPSTPAAPSAAGKGFASILPDMKRGLSFIFHHAAVLFVVLALSAGMFIMGCFGPLIAVYVRDSLHASTGVYTFATGSIGLGLFAGVNLVNALGKRLSDTTIVLSGLGGIALGLVLLAATPHIWAAVLGNLVVGLAVAGIVVPANTLIQSETPPPLMGRVGSTVMSVVFSAQVVGLVLSGRLADSIGVRNVFAVCAILLVVLVAAGKLFLAPKPPAPKAAGPLAP